METPIETTDQGRTQIIYPPPPGAVSFFKAPAQSVTPLKSADVKGIYRYITEYRPAMQATDELRAILKDVREGKADIKEARKYKASHFDFVCFSGTFSYRNDNQLIMHSGLLCIDLDHVGDRKVLWSLRERLIADPHFTTWLLFTSPSGDGLKWVIEIDLSKCDHLTWFRAMQNYVRATYDIEIDKQCSNVSRACFLPHDPVCYVHPSIFNQPDVCPF